MRVFSETITGRAWVFEDNIDTDQIIQGQYLTLLDYEKMAKHALEIPRPEFARNVKKNDIIVAGKNFGGGSSREEAPMILSVLGVGCIIAESFARLFYRNAINVGLPAIEVKDAPARISEGQKLMVSFKKGVIKIVDTDEVIEYQPIPEFMMDILRAGGAVQYYKNSKI